MARKPLWNKTNTRTKASKKSHKLSAQKAAAKRSAKGQKRYSGVVTSLDSGETPQGC